MNCLHLKSENFNSLNTFANKKIREIGNYNIVYNGFNGRIQYFVGSSPKET